MFTASSTRTASNSRHPPLATSAITLSPVGLVITPTPGAVPDPRMCEQARLSRDARFDGLFFTAVISTGIYCRPVCPARSAKRVRYFSSAAAAEAAGFRPCLRCRPELSPADGGWRRGDEVVARALKLIDQAVLEEEPLAVLAARVGIGERQLRRLFVDRVGAAPHAVRRTRRLLFAKQLLTETRLPIIQVALAAGFGSLRRFNVVFRDSYHMTPSDLRRSGNAPGAAGGETLTLRLGFRPPFDFPALLEFLRGRALPGVELVDASSYARVIGPDSADPEGKPAWLRLAMTSSDESTVQLAVHGAAPARLLGIVNRVRRMFDLDADPWAIARALSTSEALRPLVRRRPGLRLPGGWDGFETAVRAILGQQVSVAAARTLAIRLTHRFGTRLPVPLAPGIEWLFPTPDALAEADLASIGLPRARAHTIRGVAQAVRSGLVDFHTDRTLEDFVARWTALAGVGAWTAHYLALRILGHPDAFPAEDLVLRRAAASTGVPLTARAALAAAEAWRPWRAYAAIHLWRHAASSSTSLPVGR